MRCGCYARWRPGSSPLDRRHSLGSDGPALQLQCERRRRALCVVKWEREVSGWKSAGGEAPAEIQALVHRQVEPLGPPLPSPPGALSLRCPPLPSAPPWVMALAGRTLTGDDGGPYAHVGVVS